MKKTLKNLILAVGMTMLSITAFSQESFNSCGGNLSGSGGSVSYSYGQTFYSVHSGTDAYLSEGVQQPFEISVVTLFEDEIALKINLSVFPNPTADNLNLRTENVQLPLTAILFDLNGRIIKESIITESETVISLTNLEASTYFLKLSNLEKEIKTFKIIKTQ